MALVRKMDYKNPSRESIHPEVRKCNYSIFKLNGKKILKLVTYGSHTRKNPDVPSQTIQFDSDGIKGLKRILQEYDAID